MRPKFEFAANGTNPDDKSGVAIWRYTRTHDNKTEEVTTRQKFDSFQEAFDMDQLITAAWVAGVNDGHAALENKILGALK